MRIATFAWFLKDRLIKSTSSGTLDLKLLANLAMRDETLRPLFMLYVTAHTDRQQAERKLTPGLLADYGKYYVASGYPEPDAFSAMPPEYRALYKAYQAHKEDRETLRRMRICCREQLLNLRHERGISLRGIARAGGVNVSCVSRFINGCDYAISEGRLKQFIRVLGGVSTMDDIEVKDYSERRLECGMVEITFTLVMPDDVAVALDAICKENGVTLSRLFQCFLYWAAQNPDDAKAWLAKAKQEEETNGVYCSTES